MKISDITAVILAGGKNTRINREKSLIKINDDFLIDRQVNLLRKIFCNIIIITSKIELINRFSDIKTFEDQFKECGPLGGIHAAISEAETDAVFVFACDMPNLNEFVIRNQIESYHCEKKEIIVPSHREGIEPLHAIYSVKSLPFLEDNLKKGKLSVRSFYEYCDTRYLGFKDSEIKYFFNINTSEDLKKII